MLGGRQKSTSQKFEDLRTPLLWPIIASLYAYDHSAVYVQGAQYDLRVVQGMADPLLEVCQTSDGLAKEVLPCSFGSLGLCLITEISTVDLLVVLFIGQSVPGVLSATTGRYPRDLLDTI